jgi:hypothetical protein
MTITITKFNGTNYAQWATEMALLLEQKQEYGIIKKYNDKPDEPAVNATSAEKAAFKGWMTPNGVARSTIRLGREPRIYAEYMVIENSKTLREKLASAYRAKLKLNIIEIREDFRASSNRTTEMSTITHHGSMGKSCTTISALGHRPLALMLPTPRTTRMQRQLPSSVSRKHRLPPSWNPKE